MKSSRSARGRVTNVLGVMVVASLLSGVLSSRATAAQPEVPASKELVPAPTTGQPTAAELESWRRTILKTPRPNGCFTATYPEKQWREVPCKTPPHKLYPPAKGGAPRPGIVGGGDGNDYSAQVTGHVSWAEGSFDLGTVVSSNSDYSLQLNTKPFTTKTCNASPAPGSCQGWEQYVYDSIYGAFIQYWLLSYGPAGTNCPTPRGSSCLADQVDSDGWCPFSFTPGGEVYCVINAMGMASAPSEPITSLTELGFGLK